MSTKKKAVGQSNVDIRNSLEEDVEAFLKKGNKIQQIPTGLSGQAAISGKKPTSTTPAATTTTAATTTPTDTTTGTATSSKTSEEAQSKD